MGRPREFDEHAVRRAALRTFWHRGYEGTSVADLEDATGVGRRGLYNAFGDKRALFILALRDFRMGASERYLASLNEPCASVETIRQVLHRVVCDSLTEEGRNGCLVCNTAREVIASEPAIKQEIDAHFSGMTDAMMNALASGRVPVSRDEIRTIAHGLVGAMVSIFVLARAGAEARMLSDIRDRALAGLPEVAGGLD